MSTYTVESIMFDIQSDPGFAEQFKSDPNAAIQGRPLTDKEKAQILDWDLRSMSDSGVSNMLLLVAYTAVNGQEAIPEYLSRLNAPPRT